jgi:hypothetical protein
MIIQIYAGLQGKKKSGNLINRHGLSFIKISGVLHGAYCMDGFLKG